jgi:hypothetical protein
VKIGGEERWACRKTNVTSGRRSTVPGASADGLEMRVLGTRWAPSTLERESWAGLALVAEQVRDDLEAVCGVLKTEAPALQARQTCL